MAYSMSIDYSSTFQATVELMASVGKFYTTTAAIQFCLICWIISEQFQTINQQVKKLPKISSTTNLALQLRFIQNHHVLINRSIELLNESFGGILCLEIFFIFTGFTNNFIRILIQFYSAKVYNNVMALTMLANYSGNLVLVCHSAERIRAKVFLNKNKMKHFCKLKKKRFSF